MVVTCGPAQVALEYSVVAGGLFVAAWCCAFMVEVVVGPAVVSTLWSFAAGHAYVREVADL